MARYIDAETLKKSLSHYENEDAIYRDEIEMYIDDTPAADVVETKRISEILAVLFENNIVEKYIPNTANAGSWEDFLRKACSGEYGMLR